MAAPRPIAPLMSAVPASNLLGQVGVGRPLERDGADHVAAALVGRHLLEQLASAPQHADAGRAEELVAGEDVEVAAEGLDVDGGMADPLRAVDENARADFLCLSDDARDVDDRAERVARVRNADELRSVVQ